MVKKIEKKITIIEFLLKQDKTQAQIARQTGYPTSTVSRLVKKINAKGDNDKKNNNKIKIELKFLKITIKK